MEYAYQHFTRELLVEDLAWRGGPRPGQQMPEFDLPTTGGGRLRTVTRQRQLHIAGGRCRCGSSTNRSAMRAGRPAIPKRTSAAWRCSGWSPPPALGTAPT